MQLAWPRIPRRRCDGNEDGSRSPFLTIKGSRGPTLWARSSSREGAERVQVRERRLGGRSSFYIEAATALRWRLAVGAKIRGPSTEESKCKPDFLRKSRLGRCGNVCRIADLRCRPHKARVIRIVIDQTLNQPADRAVPRRWRIRPSTAVHLVSSVSPIVSVAANNTIITDLTLAPQVPQHESCDAGRQR